MIEDFALLRIGKTMTEKELREHAGTWIMGASIGIGLIVEGLDQHVEPAITTDGQRQSMHQIKAEVFAACAALSKLAAKIKQG